MATNPAPFEMPSAQPAAAIGFTAVVKGQGAISGLSLPTLRSPLTVRRADTIGADPVVASPGAGSVVAREAAIEASAAPAAH